MKIAATVFSILLILVGAVWYLQGINVIGGSVMTGQSQWSVYGSIAIVIGILLLVYTNRKKIFRS
jgi:uncharacterized membrane protein HdeD (DUF308 family)